MQHTERTTAAHHRSDFIYHVRRVSWADRQEERGETDEKSEARQTRRVRRDRREEWGETDEKSEARQTRRVRRDRREEWGETDEKSEARQTRRRDRRVRRDRQDDSRRVSKPNVKAPVLKIFWILKSLLTCHLSKMILEVFLTFVSHLFGSTVFADFYFI